MTAVTAGGLWPVALLLCLVEKCRQHSCSMSNHTCKLRAYVGPGTSSISKNSSVVDGGAELLLIELTDHWLAS